MAMEILRHIVVFIHLVGFAVLFGAWAVQAFGGNRVFTRLMSIGMSIAAVAGLILAAPWGLAEGVSVNYPKIGTKLVADMCRRILEEDIGIRGLHFYTMNLEKGTRMLLEELQLLPRVETVKPLPWRQVSELSFARLQIRLLTYLPVPHSQPSYRNYSPDLLGQPCKVIHITYRELG